MRVPKFSIIVPVYKVEKYLSQCIESILLQECRDFELLLVDDGSPDRSGDICEEYAKKDERIHVIHKENGGVSSARNLGLTHAKGEWYVFIDSDDTISPDFLNIDDISVPTDIIQKSFIIINEKTKKSIKHHVANNSLYNQDDIFQFYVRKRNNALWDKIISSRVIQENRFDETVAIGEDFLFFLSVLKQVKTYSFSSTGSYNYVVRSNSAMSLLNNNTEGRNKILLQNINHLNDILSDDIYTKLRCSLIYSTYIQSLYMNFKSLNCNQRSTTLGYLSKMKYSDLKYVRLRTKIKLFFMKFLMFIKLRYE